MRKFNIFNVRTPIEDMEASKSFPKPLMGQNKYSLAVVRHVARWQNRGTWETREASKAFVEYINRFAYICGGVWFGTRQAMLDFCETAARWTAEDQSKGIQAVWFDESYANAYFTKSIGSGRLSPAWAWTPEYQVLKRFDPLIVLVDKKDILPVQDR